jgi:hypothetical protein
VKAYIRPQAENQSSDNPPTNVDTTKDLLLKIIRKADRKRLRTILINILDTHGQLVEWLAEELLVPQRAESEDITMEGDDN